MSNMVKMMRVVKTLIQTHTNTNGMIMSRLVTTVSHQEADSRLPHAAA